MKILPYIYNDLKYKGMGYGKLITIRHLFEYVIQTNQSN